MNTITIENKKYNNDTYKKIQWVAKATSKDKIRPFMQNVLIDGGYAVATDGHRLHMAEISDDMPDGLYKIIVSNAKMIIMEQTDFEKKDFPQYERAFPTHTHNGIKPFTNYGSAPYKSALLNHVLKQAENAFDVDYLLDACSISDQRYIFRQSGVNRPLQINNDDLTMAALIMPMRSDD